jgi:hypothetical protein
MAENAFIHRVVAPQGRGSALAAAPMPIAGAT